MLMMSSLPIVNSVDVINIGDNANINPQQSLEVEVLAGLTNQNICQTLREDGLPDIHWTKSLPTSQ